MKAYYGCEYSSDMPLPSTVDDVSVSLLSPNHWVITHGDISANVLQGASDLSLDVVLEFHDSDTSSVSGQCSGKVSGSSLVSDDIQKMAESWSSSGLFCSNFTQASHAEAKRISPFNYACLDSSVDRERCCFSLKGCGDLYTQCVYDHCVLASGSCLDLTDRVRALKEWYVYLQTCNIQYLPLWHHFYTTAA